MNLGFDNLASSYDKSIKELPTDYIRLISNTFKINSETSIIDLGCGSGLMTFPLAEISKNVTGVDISKQMIEIAKEKDKTGKITWINDDVDCYDMGIEKYDLIIFYESIHLLPNIERLLERCALALKPNGYLCMGFCYYNWEAMLERDITTTFSQFGIRWGEWSYQKFLLFDDIINSGSINGLSQTVLLSTKNYEEWSVEEIASYITSISKATEISEESREAIRNKLIRGISSGYGSKIIGDTTFCIRFSKKQSNQ